MEVFVLSCMLAIVPETPAQKDLAARCNQSYTDEAACQAEAVRLKRAFGYAENLRSEGTLAGCIRKPPAEPEAHGQE